jgi:phosphatidylserine/phosphatidylglycerophosphate/cardiolipin synthase-like enzyme
MSSDALANCLEIAADALASRPQLDELVDLVTTGPDAGGIANRSTAVVVSDLFRNAQESVLIAGYAVYQGQKVFQALAERMKEIPALQVRMFLDVARRQGDTSSAEALISKFVHQFKSGQWPNGMPLPQVYCCKRFLGDVNGKFASLHAKCTVVDNQRVFVSSANFTEAAQQRNVEVGLLLQSRVVCQRILRFFDALTDAAYFVRIL